MLSAATSELLAGISLNRVSDDYDARQLDHVSDAALVAAVAHVLAVPRLEPADSFVLHAPLELAARSALLPHVSADQRRLARLRIVALAAHYEQYEPLNPNSSAAVSRSPVAADLAVANLVTAISDGDLGAAEEHARAVAATHTPAAMSAALVGDVVTRTAAAAHAPIFLYHLARRDLSHGLSAQLLAPLARELARKPDWQIRWRDHGTSDRPADATSLREAIAGMPLLGPPGSTFIHPLAMQVDETGLALKHLGPALGSRTPEAAAELLRVAAQLMLHDTPEQGPYGWSHCLTIPQAILGTTAGTDHADLGLAMAATHVAAFRVGLGVQPLIPTISPDSTPAPDLTQLATNAATSHDAHVVKYVLACLDAALDDPAAAALFYSAAQRLLDIWIDRGGDPSDPLA